VLGERWFPVAGRIYRRLAVDLELVARGFPRLADGAVILDVGGGDGEALNHVLRLNPGARATMIDLASRLGDSLAPELRGRVEVLPETSVAEYARLGRPAPDMIILSDVVHHVPAAEREGLLAGIRDLLGGAATRLVIKDVEPGSGRAKLLYLADRYVSGDANVSFIPRTAMRELVLRVFPGASWQETDLFARNPPNYCLVFTIGAAAARPSAQ
jgi:hypothetical protein